MMATGTDALSAIVLVASSARRLLPSPLPPPPPPPLVALVDAVADAVEVGVDELVRDIEPVEVDVGEAPLDQVDVLVIVLVADALAVALAVPLAVGVAVAEKPRTT